MSGETWKCLECRFVNRRCNRICGGVGGRKDVGCGQPRPSLSQMSDAMWVCRSCNFTNNGGNTQCGGVGHLGCKKSRPPLSGYRCAECPPHAAASQLSPPPPSPEPLLRPKCPCGNFVDVCTYPPCRQVIATSSTGQYVIPRTIKSEMT